MQQQSNSKKVILQKLANEVKRQSKNSGKSLVLNYQNLQHLTIVETKSLNQLGQIVEQEQLYDSLYLRNHELKLQKEDFQIMKQNQQLMTQSQALRNPQICDKTTYSTNQCKQTSVQDILIDDRGRLVLNTNQQPFLHNQPRNQKQQPLQQQDIQQLQHIKSFQISKGQK